MVRLHLHLHLQLLPQRVTGVVAEVTMAADPAVARRTVVPRATRKIIVGGVAMVVGEVIPADHHRKWMSMCALTGGMCMVNLIECGAVTEVST